jgi:hypothetical protein
MEYDFSDPNYDFGGRSAILARRLRDASAQAGAELGPQPGQMVGGFYVAPNIGQYINAAAQKVLGARDLARVEAEQEALNKEQLRRYEDISKQLATPGSKTVLKRTLGEDLSAGPSMQETSVQVPLDYSNPEDLAADNARRMGLAMQMSKLQLPMAQKVAQDYLVKGAAFPDTLATLQMRQIEAGQQSAQRALEKERSDAQYRLQAGQQYQLAQDRIQAQRDKAEADRELAREKLDMQRQQRTEKVQGELDKKQAAYQASIESMTPIEVGINKLLTPPDETGKRKITPALEAYTGNLDQYMPDFALRQQTVDAGKTLNALKDQVMLVNLSAAKTAVGQSFGSMQLKEWDKFVNKLSSLDRALGPKELADNLNYIDNWMKNHRAELELKLAEAKKTLATSASPGGEVKTFRGVAYRKKPGTSGDYQADWEPVR